MRCSTAQHVMKWHSRGRAGLQEVQLWQGFQTSLQAGAGHSDFPCQLVVWRRRALPHCSNRPKKLAGTSNCPLMPADSLHWPPCTGSSCRFPSQPCAPQLTCSRCVRASGAPSRAATRDTWEWGATTCRSRAPAQHSTAQQQTLKSVLCVRWHSAALARGDQSMPVQQAGQREGGTPWPTNLQ